MKTKSWALALALALATTTVAESRPRIYFPRHVKRQFSNGGETRDQIFPPASKLEDDGQNGLNNNRLSSPNADPTNGFIQGNDEGSGSEPLATRADESIIVLNIPNTVVVEPSNPPSNKENDPQGRNTDPGAQARPTPPPSSESQNNGGEDDSTGTKDSPADSLTIPSSEDSDIGVTITPTGVVLDGISGDSTESNDEDDASDSTSSQDTTEADPTDEPAETSTDTTDTVDQTTGDEDSTVTTPDTTDSVGQGKDDTPTEEEPTDKDDDDDSLIDIVGGILNPDKNSTTPTEEEPTDKDDDDDSLIDVVGGILNPDKNSTTPTEPQQSTVPDPSTSPIDEDDEDEDADADDDDDSLIDIIGGILNPDKNSTTPTEDDDDATLPPTNSDDEDQPPIPVITGPPVLTDLPLPDPTDIVSSIGDDIPIPLPPIVNTTNPAGNGTNGPDDDGSIITIPDPRPTDVPSGQNPDDDGAVGGSTTEAPNPQPTGGEETTLPPTITVPGTDAPSTPPPTPLPGTGDDEGEDNESSELPHSTLPIGNNTSGGQAEPTQAPAGPAVVEPGTPVTSIAVVSTVTGTPDWLGTELVADKTASVQEQAVAAPAPTQSTETLPAGMPKTIEATEDDNPVQPEGSQLIRVVFDRRLHYEFVADNFTAAQQIFTFLPKIIAFGENIDEGKIQMMRLAPVNSKNNGWFPTGAYLYVPTSVIAPLSADIHLPNSLLYHHEYPVAFQLASAIDPSFGIMPAADSDAQGDEAIPGGAPFSNSEDKPEEQTPQQKGATAGIAMGAVTVAVAYGAAMFIVARRYKRKKQAHRRASSITNTSDMRYSPSGSPAMMGGALLSRDFSGYGGVGGVPGGRESHGSGRSGAGNSGRTAYISAPVAAENSLGWN